MIHLREVGFLASTRWVGLQHPNFWNPYIHLDPGAAVTKSPPPVIFCQVGVSHVTESQPPVIFMPT